LGSTFVPPHYISPCSAVAASWSVISTCAPAASLLLLLLLLLLRPPRRSSWPIAGSACSTTPRQITLAKRSVFQPTNTVVLSVELLRLSGEDQPR
jgi:hypothetical protein